MNRLPCLDFLKGPGSGAHPHLRRRPLAPPCSGRDRRLQRRACRSGLQGERRVSCNHVAGCGPPVCEVCVPGSQHGARGRSRRGGGCRPGIGGHGPRHMKATPPPTCMACPKVPPLRLNQTLSLRMGRFPTPIHPLSLRRPPSGPRCTPGPHPSHISSRPCGRRRPPAPRRPCGDCTTWSERGTRRRSACSWSVRCCARTWASSASSGWGRGAAASVWDPARTWARCSATAGATAAAIPGHSWEMISQLACQLPPPPGEMQGELPAPSVVGAQDTEYAYRTATSEGGLLHSVPPRSVMTSGLSSQESVSGWPG